MWRNPYFRVNKHLQLVYSSRAVCPNKKWLLLAGRADVDLEREREEGERHDDGDNVERAQIVRLQNDFLTRKPSSWTWKRDGEGGGRKRLDDAKACFAATHDADLCKALYAGMKNAWRKTHLQSSCLHPYHTPAQASRVTCDPWWIVPVVGFGASWTWTGEEEEEKKRNEKNNIYIYIYIFCKLYGVLCTCWIVAAQDSTHIITGGQDTAYSEHWCCSTKLYMLISYVERLWINQCVVGGMWNVLVAHWAYQKGHAPGTWCHLKCSVLWNICKRWRERYLDTVCVSTFFDFFLRI